MQPSRRGLTNEDALQAQGVGHIRPDDLVTAEAKPIQVSTQILMRSHSLPQLPVLVLLRAADIYT